MWEDIFIVSQRHRDGRKKSEKEKSGTGRGGSCNGRDVGNEANYVEGERLSAGGVRQSPDFAFTVGQSSDHLSSDNGVVTLNVGGLDLSNVLIDSVVM